MGIYFMSPSINCITNFSPSTWSNTFSSDSSPLITISYILHNKKQNHPTLGSSCSSSTQKNKTCNHQSSSTSRPTPSTASPIAPHLHGPTSSTVIPHHQLHHHDQLLIYALPFVVKCLPLIMTKVVYWQSNPFNSDVFLSQRISMSSVP